MDTRPITLSDIDTTRAMRTADELQTLVQTIHGSRPDTQESNWLEWKNGLDLTKAAGKFAVAKAILGFANRSVEQAQLACEGVAYMVVGVEPGAAAGVGAVDHAELGQAIKTYVDGARWTPFYIPFEGVTVLVIVVEAPRPGDPIHTLQKTYNDGAKYNAAAGTVFHRGTAHTEPAGTGEIDMLSRRLVQGVQRPELDLEVECTAEPLTRISIEQEELEDWLRRREAYVRANSGKPPDRPAPSARRTGPAGLAGMSTFDLTGSIGALGLGNFFADHKDSEEFEKRVSDYLVKMRNRLLDNVVRNIVLDDEANTVHFVVGNKTNDPVTGVQLTVRIPKNGLLVCTSPPSVDDLPLRPRWPDPLDQMRENVYAASVRSPALDFYPHAGAVIDKGDVFEATWDVGDLRPHEEADGYTITVVTGPNAPDQLPVEMIARAMDRRGTRTKTEQLTVAPEAWTVDDFYDAEPQS
ncbi:hypothetical protein C5U48_20775 [Mycolicibacter virginiensis]|uniref:Uncharacterized protein n=1 Tax=Mycolicibacter virginiensis TaxID=1795032 RepID=A0A9X7IJT6_9MYCO|nr:hypothetical protein [Mycolicibacter virginiensis]PQM50315.1 hypothetical protein C5U48_20775 [Mycolicibacter virginiensis]